MSATRLLEPDIQSFITEHEHDDVAALALKKSPQKDWPYALILDQIKARQKARQKVPSWLKIKNIILPFAHVIEQGSSTATAKYKASLCTGENFADLTGGVGIDTAALSANFQNGFCIELDENNASLLQHNLPLLGGKNVQVLNMRAEDFVRDMAHVDFIYLDPQRRDESRRGKFRFEDCSPNIIELLPHLKATRILLKTSPMLDIVEACQLLKCVESVHVIELRGECKEVLYMLNPSQLADLKLIPINAVAVDEEGFPVSSFSFTRAQEEEASPLYAKPGRYLYEPGPAFQKAGGFAAMAEFYGAAKLHKHTHLYSADQKIENFPGRKFEIFDMLPAGGKSLPFATANLTLRNFPGTTESLRKKLGLSEGGDIYIFACTLQDDRKMLLLTHKI